MDLALSVSPWCLIIDDEGVVAMDLEERIAEAGFNVYWVDSLPNASAILDVLTPDIVVLDVMVRARTSMPLVHKLKARAIPFIVHSGYSPEGDLGTFDDLPWVRKPADIAAMVQVMKRLLQDTRVW